MGNICSQTVYIKVIPEIRRTSILNNKQEIQYNAGIFVQENKENFYSVYSLAKDPIGTGAFAEVWLCTHKRTRDTRAVKIFLKSTLTEEEISTRSVFNEVEILKSLDHPNVLKVYEFFEDDAKCYIVMEYCGGGDLFDKTQQSGTLTERYSAKVMRLLLTGLNYMHSKQVVHRDIKPENILLTNKGKFEDFNIKIIDFNIATVKKSKNIRGIYGTTDYMAPEVFRGIYNEKCDMWSCGVVLYVMLSAVLPFPSPNDEVAEKAICQGKYSFPKEYFGSVSKECKDLITKLLVKNPNSRLSAKEALQHPWLKKGEEKIDKFFVSTTIRKMKSQFSSGRLRDLFKTFMISQLSCSMPLKKLEQVFYAIDINGDGVISREELVKQLSLEMSIDEAELKACKMMAMIDNDGSGEIDYTEFLKVAIDEETLFTKSNLKKAFLYLDKDGSNAIEKSELQEWLSTGDILPEYVINDLMEEADANGDGTIDLIEFEQLLISVLEMNEPCTA